MVYGGTPQRTRWRALLLDSFSRWLAHGRPLRLSGSVIGEALGPSAATIAYPDVGWASLPQPSRPQHPGCREFVRDCPGATCRGASKYHQEIVLAVQTLLHHVAARGHTRTCRCQGSERDMEGCLEPPLERGRRSFPPMPQTSATFAPSENLLLSAKLFPEKVYQNSSILGYSQHPQRGAR